MHKLKLNIRQFNDVSKIKLIFVLLIFLVTLTFTIPSLARYKNYVNLETMFNETQTWDGSIAESFNSGTGTQEDPYIISNASEFAFFATNIDENGYSGTYFKLSNHIVLNDGLFGYDGTNITYNLNDTLFYLREYSGDAYDNSELTGNVISAVNVFESIENFKGYFDGDFYTIYGLYLTEDTSELALFKNMSGKVENVYFKNSFVYGGSSTAILANNVSFGEVNNVSTDGIVVGKGEIYSKTINMSLDDFTGSKSMFSAYSGTLSINRPTGFTFDSIVLSGNYAFSSNSQNLSINGQSFAPGDFEVSLDVSATEVPLSLGRSWDFVQGTITLSNLNVIYTYNYPIASGFVANSNDSNFNNVINKAKVYGTNVSGLVGIGANLSISNGYNLGTLTGSNVSGIVSVISNNDSTVIDKVYNNGELSGTTTNLVGNIANSGSVILGNSFNTQSANTTFGNVSGTVQATNLYDVNSNAVISGSLTGSVNVVTEDSINKDLLVNTLGYGEYVDNDDIISNPNNIWVYEYEDTPILYIDELNNPIASLNISTYSWNDLGYELNNLKFIDSKAFNVTPANDFTEFKEIYYYIYEGQEPLNKSDILSISEWTVYDDIVALDKEGYYIVYIKVVDQNDYNYYINSDVMLFDLYGPDINITLEDNKWDSYDNDLDSIYINDVVTLNVDVTDKYSTVVESYYYVSQVFVTKEELDNIDTWSNLDSYITIDKKGPNIVYVKSVDSNGHVNVINSDYIIYGGYNGDLSIGSHEFNSVDVANISYKSSVLYRFTYDDDIPYTDGYNTKLIVNNVLPEKTLIMIVDHKTNSIYSYDVTSSDGTEISLNKFVKLGNTNSVLFDDIAYLVEDDKEISLLFDFSNTSLQSNYSFNAYLELRDGLDNVVLSTLKDTIKNTNVYVGVNSELNIVNNSVIYGINYDSNSKNLIEFEYSFTDLVLDNVVVNDTFYEDLKSGISIKLVDSNGDIVDKKYLKNMEFIVDGTNYFADSDGIVRIKMSDGIDKVTGGLTVVTYENDMDLSEGSYSLVIEAYVASDGKYSDNYSTSKISIPVVSDYEEILDFEFNVKMNDEMKILMKDSGNVVLPFDIVSNNEFEDPSVRISLYKKQNLTAYDQVYDLIDLSNYLNDELVLATDYSYVISGEHLDLNINLSNMDKTGYEIRFELFDGNRKIDVIKKKFIVR